jgi:hypothetical protein
MPTDTLNVDICYRPLKVGWAVRSGDFDALRKIIRFSHTIWGGRFNPIIVIDDADHAKGLVELFRVDLVWPQDNAADMEAFVKGFPHLINPFYSKSLVVTHSNDERHAQLLDVHNALISMRERGELQALQERGVRVYSWADSDPLSDFFLIQLGAYPDPKELGIDYPDMLAQALGPTSVAIPSEQALASNLFEHPSIAYLPRHRMERHYTSGTGWDYPGFYVGDVTDFADLVTYWNLRAADNTLLFVDPNHLNRYADLIPAWKNRLKEMLAGVPEFRRSIAVWTRRDDAQKAAEVVGDDPKTLCQLRETSWNGGAVVVPFMYLGDAQSLGTVSRSNAKPRVSFQLNEKPFTSHKWFYTQHVVASLSFIAGLFGDDQFTLSVPYVPELNEHLSREMHFDYSKLRSEPNRIGAIIDVADADLSITALAVGDLFERLFGLSGFKAQPSNGGLIARQIIALLGGLQGCKVFKIPGVRRLLRKHGPTASFTRHAALELIGQTDPDDATARFSDHTDLYIEAREIGTKLTPSAVFAYLVAKGLFRIGADLTCSVCRLASWSSLDDLKQRMRCSLCGNEFEATRQLLSEQWAYRRSGVMGLEKNNQGAVPVALTLQQLDANSMGFNKRLYAPSLDLTPKDGSLPCEVDFVWLVCREGRRQENTVIFGECKDGMAEAIDERDIENLRRVADSFLPQRFQRFILLAKLGKFSEREIALAKTLNGKYQSRVIMLTTRELEPHFLLERTKKEFDIGEHASSPEQLAQVTQKIYFAS